MRAIDFFCGGGGMTRGLLDAGIDVIAGLDIDDKCKETYEFNNAPAKFIHEDITKLDPKKLEQGIVVGNDNTHETIVVQRNDDNMLFVGCSPCQFWSLINTEKTKAEKSKNLIADFQRFIDFFNPGYVVIENVPGLATRSGSPLNGFIDFLSRKGYFSIAKNIIKVSQYGVPQTRKRFVLIASRVTVVSLPKAVENANLTVRDFIGDKEKFPVIAAGHRDDSDFCHTAARLSPRNLRRIENTSKNGGTRRDWKDTELQLDVYRKNEDVAGFVFTDVYGRMWWERLAPTITTRFPSISNGRFGHPDQDRAISLREGATLQTFRTSYVFKTSSKAVISRIIGNAVPPELAKRIGASLVS